MNYDYDVAAMRKVLAHIIASSLSSEQWNGLQEKEKKFEQEKQIAFFNLTFTAIARLVSKDKISPEEDASRELQNIRRDFSVQGWTADRLARTWWLLQLPADDKARYIGQLENLFLAAEMNEQVALYGALPLLAYPESFRKRASEGLRTNIRSVFEAVALDNPYAAAYFDEAAWNQMVLKAFFMDVAINRILGLDQRANATLAHILSDYAHERWAAGRKVNPLLWRPVGKFIDEKIWPDIEKLFQSSDEKERQAAALACARSDFALAKHAIETHQDLQKQIEKGTLTWQSQ